MERFGRLLAADARWGDDTHPRACRNREQVLATFARLMGEGVDGVVAETAVGSRGVMCRIQIDWPNPENAPRGSELFQVYLLRDGLITEIRGYDDRESAMDAIGEL